MYIVSFKEALGFVSSNALNVNVRNTQYYYMAYVHELYNSFHFHVFWQDFINNNNNN
jgi:hypothetical protein